MLLNCQPPVIEYLFSFAVFLFVCLVFFIFYLSGAGYKGRRNPNCCVQGNHSSMAAKHSLVFWYVLTPNLYNKWKIFFALEIQCPFIHLKLDLIQVKILECTHRLVKDQQNHKKRNERNKAKNTKKINKIRIEETEVPYLKPRYA